MKKLILPLIFLFLACSKDEMPIAIQNVTNPDQNLRKEAQDNDGEFVLGNKKENPYSLKNMEMALKELQKNNKTLNGLAIEATHYYVRIEAETEDAFINIQRNKDLDLYRYPLDYEVKKSGTTYHEKDAETKYPVFWAAVPLDFVIAKDLKVKVLEKLFLPQGNGNKQKDNKPKLTENILAAIEDKALQLFDPEYNGGKSSKITGNYVSGTIRVFDSYKQTFLPLIGVQISAKRWFTTAYATTGQNGFYYVYHEFNGPADITITYSNPKFVYQIEKFTGLGYNYFWGSTTANNITGNWSPSIVGVASPGNYFSTDAWRLASSFRAAYDYYYKHPTTYGINPPPSSGALMGQSSIGILFMGIKHPNSCCIDASHTWFNPGLQSGNHIIFNFYPSSSYTSNANYNSFDIYGTTIHEMTHAKHFGYGLTRSNYMTSKSTSTLGEAYALAMEYKITMDEYNVKGTTTVHDNIKSNREYDYKDLQKEETGYYSNWIGTWDPTYGGITTKFKSAYTPYLIDLIDNSNQQNQSISNINDVISGISIAQIDAIVATYPNSSWYVNNSLINSNPSQSNNISYLYNIYFANK